MLSSTHASAKLTIKIRISKLLAIIYDQAQGKEELNLVNPTPESLRHAKNNDKAAAHEELQILVARYPEFGDRVQADLAYGKLVGLEVMLPEPTETAEVEKQDLIKKLQQLANSSLPYAYHAKIDLAMYYQYISDSDNKTLSESMKLYQAVYKDIEDIAKTTLALDQEQLHLAIMSLYNIAKDLISLSYDENVDEAIKIFERIVNPEEAVNKAKIILLPENDITPKIKNFKRSTYNELLPFLYSQAIKFKGSDQGKFYQAKMLKYWLIFAEEDDNTKLILAKMYLRASEMKLEWNADPQKGVYFLQQLLSNPVYQSIANYLLGINCDLQINNFNDLILKYPNKESHLLKKVKEIALARDVYLTEASQLGHPTAIWLVTLGKDENFKESNLDELVKGIHLALLAEEPYAVLFFYWYNLKNNLVNTPPEYYLYDLSKAIDSENMLVKLFAIKLFLMGYDINYKKLKLTDLSVVIQKIKHSVDEINNCYNTLEFPSIQKFKGEVNKLDELRVLEEKREFNEFNLDALEKNLCLSVEGEKIVKLTNALIERKFDLTTVLGKLWADYASFAADAEREPAKVEKKKKKKKKKKKDKSSTDENEQSYTELDCDLTGGRIIEDDKAEKFLSSPSVNYSMTLNTEADEKIADSQLPEESVLLNTALVREKTFNNMLAVGLASQINDALNYNALLENSQKELCEAQKNLEKVLQQIKSAPTTETNQTMPKDDLIKEEKTINTDMLVATKLRQMSPSIQLEHPVIYSEIAIKKNDSQLPNENSGILQEIESFGSANKNLRIAFESLFFSSANCYVMLHNSQQKLHETQKNLKQATQQLHTSQTKKLAESDNNLMMRERLFNSNQHDVTIEENALVVRTDTSYRAG